jgi:glucose-6-phosphate isomerase
MEDNSLNNSQHASRLRENFNNLKQTHLRNLIADENRNSRCVLSFENLIFDFTHEKLDLETLDLLEKLAEERKVRLKFEQMFNGEKINITENRSVLHTALRRKAEDKLLVDGIDVVSDVHKVLHSIKKYSDQVRST